MRLIFRFFLMLLIAMISFSCSNRTLELDYKTTTTGKPVNEDPSDRDDHDDDDDHDNDDDDDDDDDDDNNKLGKTSKWEGEMTTSGCGTHTDYTIEIKFKYVSDTQVTAEVEINNKWLANDGVKYYAIGDISGDSILLTTQYKIEDKERTCKHCDKNKFKFEIVSKNVMKGKWLSADCSGSAYSDDNSITLKRD